MVIRRLLRQIWMFSTFSRTYRGNHPPKSMIHIAYPPSSTTFINFSLSSFNWRFFLIYVFCLLLLRPWCIYAVCFTCRPTGRPADVEWSFRHQRNRGHGKQKWVEGPSIKFVTLFLDNFYPPPPCHTSAHIPGSPPPK